MLRGFWIDNQRFLLAVGAALVVFLLADSALSGLADEASDTWVDCRRIERRVDGLEKDLQRTWAAELERLESWRAQERALRGDLEMPPEPDLSGVSSLLVGLNKEIGDVWAEAQRKASARGLVLPAKLTADDFGVDPKWGRTEYGILHSYVAIIDRALGALIDAGMTRIGAPEPIPETEVQIRTETSAVGTCLYRGVAIPVTGSYEAFHRLFIALQKPGGFLQVRLVDALRAARRGEEGQLRTRLEFYGLRVRGSDEVAAIEPQEADAAADGGIPGLSGGR